MVVNYLIGIIFECHVKHKDKIITTFDGVCRCVFALIFAAFANVEYQLLHITVDYHISVPTWLFCGRIDNLVC